MRLTGKIVGANIDFRTGKPTVNLEINEKNDFKLMVDELKDCEKLSIEIKPHRARRSLDANAYCWVLIDKLAEKLKESKEAIYRQYIRDIGGNSETICATDDAVDSICKWWSQRGLGWQAEPFPSKIEGCTNIVLYCGSSEYDSAQMARLLDLIIQDCREQGIPTETPSEIARLKSMWGE